MDNISFFLSSDSINNILQSENQSYGPIVENSTSTKYRVTSKLSVEDKMVYSVSEGEIIVTNSDNPDLVNIFLKPQINYAELSGIPKIKYFVYRGIQKSSFFDANGSVIETTTPNNEMLKSIINGNLSSDNRKENFKGSFEAIKNITNANNISIDLLYVQEDYYQISIAPCKPLGIASEQFGFEIMLEENGFNPTITEHARLLENIIDITSLSAIEAEIKKLEILNYIDPAAFFGSFFRDKNTIVDPSNEKSIKDGTNGIYDKFIKYFYTKNTVYLDIRNRFGLPPTINRNGENFTSLKISTNGNLPSSVVNYTTNDWPIHIINTSFANSVTESKGYNFFKIRIEIPNKHEKEFLHVITYHLGDSWTKIKKYNKDCNYKKLEAQDINWEKDVELRVLKFDATNPVASYIRTEIALYSDENKVKDQIVNYKLHELSAETISNQLSPTLINLGHTDNLTRDKNVSGNKYNTYTFGLGNTLFSETKNISCELTQGKAIDSIGEVCFAYRTANNIQVSGISLNKDRIADKGVAASYMEKETKAKSFAYNVFSDSISGTNKLVFLHLDYNPQSKKTDKQIFANYGKFALIHNSHKLNKNIFSAHKVKFADDGDKRTLEVRVNDPIILRGFTGNSPAECFLSIAYTYSQRETIIGLINSAFISNKFVTFVSAATIEITTSGRKIFKQNFKLLGLKATGNSLELQEEPLDITFYSIDGSNFVTPEYADLFRNEFGKDNTQINRIITNDVIPQFETGNPFESTVFGEIITVLTGISDNGNRNRILHNEVRDYLYDGDLDNLTFEIAFRLPFYIEDITKIPYTDKLNIRTNVNIGENQKTYTKKLINNPYIKYFKNWFDQANNLRGLGNIELLRRTGLAEDYDNTKIEAYQVFGFSSNFFKDPNTKIYETEKVHAYKAKMMDDENKHSSYVSEPHLPGNKYGSKLTIKSTELDKLIDKIITQDIKDRLLLAAESDFVFYKIKESDAKKDLGSITLGSHTGTINLDLFREDNTNKIWGITRFLYSPKNDTNFYLWNNPGFKNNSSVTVGFGFDTAQQSFKLFKKYTPYNNEQEAGTDKYPPDWQNILNTQDIKEVKEGSGPTLIKREDVLKLTFTLNSNRPVQEFMGKLGALDLFRVFKDVVWDLLDFPYKTAVKITPEFIERFEANNDDNSFRKSNYPVLMIHPLLEFTSNSEPVLSNTGVAQISPNSPYYYENNGLQYMNDVEKFITTSITYNGAGGGANLMVNSGSRKYARIARYIVHAINTHDIRWLKLLVDPPIAIDITDWYTIHGGRNPVLKRVLNLSSVIKHFRTKINE